jgi:hypothetical protein
LVLSLDSKPAGNIGSPGFVIETGSADYVPKNLVKAIMVHRSAKRESLQLWHICQPVCQPPFHRAAGKKNHRAIFPKIPRKGRIPKGRNRAAA